MKTVILFLLITILLAGCGDFTATPTRGPVAESTMDPTNTAAPTTAPATTVVTATATPVPNQQITSAPGQLPTKQTSTTPATTAGTTAGSTPTNTQPEIAIGQQFQLKMGQTGRMTSNGLTIKFVSVTEDSRCPGSNGTKMVACAWAGQVTAVLEIKQGSNPVETISLTYQGTTPPKNLPASAIKNIGPNQLQLLSVEPHPIIDEKINPADYVATLQILTGNYQPPSPTTKPTTANPTTTRAVPTTSKATTPAQSSPNTDATPVAINKGQPFQLRMNQTAYLLNNDLYVTFLDVTEDSRCPGANGNKTVECYWAGQVVIELLVKQGNNPPQTIKVNTKGGTGSTQATVGSGASKVTIEFQKVEPRKIIDVEIQPYDYLVTLQVS